MAEDPIRSIITELGAELSQRKHSDTVWSRGGKNCFEITASKFRQIRPADAPKKIAFIDGGDAMLDESPNYLITLNRVYFSLFRGKERIKTKMPPRIQFFSYVLSRIIDKGGKKEIIYDTRLFPHNAADARFLPAEGDLSSSTEQTGLLQSSKLNSIARIFAEWQMSYRIVDDELDAGDMLVKDGSLQTGFKNEIEYAKKLYGLAAKKGVIVCGLTKTSRLITESCDPLFARIDEISEAVKYDRWYVEVAEEITRGDMGFTFAVKLHKKSRYVFRFEILREQYEKMGREELDCVLGSLADNAGDVEMPGYPYGSIDADKFAKIRKDELGMYRRFVLAERSRRPEWKKLERYSYSLTAHAALNGATS